MTPTQNFERPRDYFLNLAAASLKADFIESQASSLASTISASLLFPLKLAFQCFDLLI